MKLTRYHICITGFIISIAVVVGIKYLWLSKAREVTGRVIAVEVTGYSMQTYPVIQFPTEKGMETIKGSYNLGYGKGDAVPLLYNPSNPQDFKINSFMSLWLIPGVWAFFFLCFWGFLMFAIIPNKKYRLTGRGFVEVQDKSEGIIPYAEVEASTIPRGPRELPGGPG